MKNHYLCPHCRGHLRVGDHIIFKIRNTRREKGLLLLHPEIGDFTSMKHPQFNFEEGERIDFFCPICLQNLDAAVNEDLIQLVMIDAQYNEHDVYFSRIASEQNTHKVSERSVMETGEYFHRYTRFKMTDEFIQSNRIDC